MLARSAQGHYWMSRYLARAEHLSRLLRMQTEALVDRPVREIHFGWSRIYESAGRLPPFGELELLDDDYTLADSYTLANDLTFERSNPDSIWNRIAYGRENARQMRNHISAEMWTRLNLAYLGIQELAIEEIWKSSPERFYANVVTSINTFAGVAAATMYRGEGWRFMQVGHSIESAQLVANLLTAQICASNSVAESSEGDWTSLLRLFHAQEAYTQRYSVQMDLGQVLDLLTADPFLAGSLRRSLGTVADQFAALGQGSDSAASDSGLKLANELIAEVDQSWGHPDRLDRLRRIGAHCREIHDMVTSGYFDYRAEDDPPT